jgi:thiamine biosynthesis lipoprotein
MKKREVVRKNFKALGTDIAAQLVCDESSVNDAEKKLDELQKFYLSAQKIFSRFDPESELNQFNQNLGEFNKTSPHFLAVARKILDYYKLSEGMFDPRVIAVLEQIGYAKDFNQMELFLPVMVEANFSGGKSEDLERDLIIQDKAISFNQRMDFAGIAKGYITDTIGTMLKQSGWEDFLLDSGGDMLVSGKDANLDDWRIDVEGISQERILLILQNEAVATSGIGKRKWQRGEKRFHHLVNPREPEKFYFDLQSVTVVAKTVMEADFWAKILFLKGKVEGKKFARENKIRAIFLDYRGNAWVSGEMKNNLRVIPAEAGIQAPQAIEKEKQDLLVKKKKLEDL